MKLKKKRNILLPFYHSLFWGNFMKSRQSWGLRDDGGDGPTAIEATPWTRVDSIQCVDLAVQPHIALLEKFYCTLYNNITSKVSLFQSQKILFRYISNIIYEKNICTFSALYPYALW